MYIEVNDSLMESVNRWALQRGLSLTEGLEIVLREFFTKKETRVEGINNETMFLSERTLAENWLKPEEEEAWDYLQSVKL